MEFSLHRNVVPLSCVVNLNSYNPVHVVYYANNRIGVVHAHMNSNTMKKKKKWFERYLPFVARSTEGQVNWLVSVLKKDTLSLEEVSPYVKLMLAEKNNEEKKCLTEQLGNLNNDVIGYLLQAADIYDTPHLVKLIPNLTEHHAEIALRKTVPPYEKKPLMVLDKVFYAINEANVNVLEQVADKIIRNGNGPEGFRENYIRFRGILEDEDFLLSMYPNARG